jgi:ubiquinone/menaquinone biosynthesis C-methylase UbiE
MQKADYAKIASFYDKGTSLSQQNSDRWLELVSKYSKATAGAKVLDLGCGTGRFALPMAHELGFRMTGADAFEEMLAKAREKDTTGLVVWDRQEAERLTYADDSFDVVFMSHLVHHLDSPLTAICECKRVLKTPGTLLVRYGAIEQIRGDVVHTLFPEALAIDEARTPTVKVVETWLREAGFTSVTSEEIVQQSYGAGAERLNATKFKNTSILTLISQKAYETGFQALAEHVKSKPDDPWLLFDRLTLTIGYKN